MPKFYAVNKFRPLLTTATYDNIEQRIAMANAGGYGPAATFWAQDFARADDLMRHVTAGHIKVKSQPGLALSDADARSVAANRQESNGSFRDSELQCPKAW